LSPYLNRLVVDFSWGVEPFKKVTCSEPGKLYLHPCM